MKELSNENLVLKTESLVKEERRITSEVLDCLREIEARMIYAELGFSSLYEFCVKRLKYSEGSAHRRISAMRVLKGLAEPARLEAQIKIESGSLSITNLSLVHGFLKAESLEKKTYSPEEKQSLIGSIENQSKRDVEKRLAEIQPKAIPKESKRVITPSLTEIKFVADETFLKNLDRVREISAHVVPSGAIAELLERVVNEYLIRHDPQLKVDQKEKNEAKSKKELNQATSPATKP